MTKVEMDLFTEEIELAIAQNGYVEMELNSLVACLIRKYGEDLSVRDVTTRRKTEISSRFCGQKGFPDYVILEREKSNNAEIYGAVEIKAPNNKLDLNSDQLKSHIETFGKVIYTNGLEWYFLEKGKTDKCICIGELGKNGQVYNSNIKEWVELCNQLSKFYHIK